MLVGPGEGAGVIDIGDGLAIAIRIESHNHPSAVEPYQGAATGVGGIIRDVFSMGARPIALMDPLRFGTLDDARTRYLFEGVVSGISGYGNAVGVPTVGGEVVFDDMLSRQPARQRAVSRHAAEGTARARPSAEGVDNLAVLLGSSTGRDGIGGASVLASAGFEEGERGEAALGAGRRPVRGEATDRGVPRAARRRARGRRAGPRRRRPLVRGFGDRGQGRRRHGRRRRARRQARAGHERGRGDDVGEPGADARDRRRPPNLDAVLELRAALGGARDGRSGRVTDTGALPRVRRAVRRDRRAGREPAAAASATTRPRVAPIASRSPTCPSGASATARCTAGPLARPPTRGRAAGRRPRAELARRFAAGSRSRPASCSRCSRRRPSPTSRGCPASTTTSCSSTPSSAPGGDAAVLRLKGTTQGARARRPTARRGSASSTRAPARRLVVLEAARNVACVGARPRALVNCLNFGNPEHPEVMWQFAEVVDGMSEACEALGIPVVGGNVSFYNESRGADIDPTPVVGVRRPDRRARRDRRPAPRLRAGDAIVVLGRRPRPSSAARSGPRWCTAATAACRRSPISTRRARAARVRRASSWPTREVDGVHDCADGGLAVALARDGDRGARSAFTVDLEHRRLHRRRVACFAESASRRRCCAVDPATVSADVLGARGRAAACPATRRRHARWRPPGRRAARSTSPLADASQRVARRASRDLVRRRPLAGG